MLCRAGAGGRHLPVLPRPCCSRQVPSSSPFFLYSSLFTFFSFPFPFCFFPFVSQYHVFTLPLPCSRVPVSVRGERQHTPGALGFMTTMSSSGGRGGGLCSRVPQDCNNWRDSSWQAATPRALHRGLTHPQPFCGRGLLASPAWGQASGLHTSRRYRGALREHRPRASTLCSPSASL